MVATARQAELKTKNKSTYSVALVTNYTFGRSQLGIAAQYYAGIDIYDVMEPAPGSFVRPIDLALELQSDEFLKLQGAAESVFNVAIGYEYEVSESLSILGGIRNDMSYFNKDLNKEAEIS